MTNQSAEPMQFHGPDGFQIEFYALGNALNAARDVITEHGKPGTLDRVERLRAYLEVATDTDPVLAIMVAAAVWTDRYGTSGSPGRLTTLRDAVARLEQAASPTGDQS